MLADALRAELKELHRGRGVRRPHVRAWVGPQLLALVGADETSPEEVVRTRLIGMIRTSAESFPQDLRLLFLAAVGITDDRPFLEERLEAVSLVLDRGTRVLRRRLREAEQIMAAQLLMSVERDESAEPPWSWVRYELDLDLVGQPRVRLDLVARARTARVDSLSLTFAAPPVAAGKSEPTFVAISGCDVRSVARLKPTLWEAIIGLPSPVDIGERVSFALQIDVPGRNFLDPYLVMMPLRPMERIRTSVAFGAHASTAWVIRDAVPTRATTDTAHEEPVDLIRSSRVDAVFDDPEVGLAYGVGWTWADLD